MEVFIKGKSKQTLSNRDFLAAGGEGSVFAKSGLAYKVYTDVKKMIPEAKVQELSVLDFDNIIRPIDVLLDKKNNAIGYTMRHVTDTFTLCQMFTKAFRNREGLTNDKVFSLVQKMQETVKHIHSKNILIVDCNEMNFLVPKSFDDVYFIDVDSYQTPNFKATALMESVRDRHNAKFSKLTDWFSWGIITFQLFVGIHPYKGTHSIKNIDERMLKNISVFNTNVSLPKVVLPLDVIPSAYRSWYQAIFEEGKRIEPPTDAVLAIVIDTKLTEIKGSDKFEINLIDSFDNIGSIVEVCFNYGTRIVLGTKKIFVNKKSEDVESTKNFIGFTPQLNHPIKAQVVNKTIKLKNLGSGKEVEGALPGDRLFTYQSRIYSVKDGSVYEAQFIETPQKTIVSGKVIANIMPQSSKIFEGCILQSMLEAAYLSVFPEKGVHYQVRIKELEKTKIADAKYENNVLMVECSNRQGVYNRYMFRFSKNHDSYDVFEEKDITLSGLNFTVLENGNCVYLNEKEEIVIIKNQKDDKRKTVIQDPVIKSNMQLCKHGTQVLIFSKEKLYSIKMKN